MSDEVTLLPRLFEPLENNQIRILVLHPSKDPKAPLLGHHEIQTLMKEGDDMQAPDWKHYAALSHCWSNLTKPGSIMLDTGGIELDLNMQLALLNIRHDTEETRLWVDSICINQFDSKDWHSHAKLMHRIYSQAAFIMAWSSNDYKTLQPKSGDALAPKSRGYSDQFQEDRYSRVHDHSKAQVGEVRFSRAWSSRDAFLQEMLALRRLRLLSEKAAHILRYIYLDDLHSPPDGINVDSTWRSQIALDQMYNQARTASDNRRGWVLQERLMASRVVHFCHDQIAWECAEFEDLYLEHSTNLLDYQWDEFTGTQQYELSKDIVSFIGNFGPVNSGIRLTPLVITPSHGQENVMKRLLLLRAFEDRNRRFRKTSDRLLTAGDMETSSDEEKIKQKMRSIARVRRSFKSQRLKAANVAIQGYVMFWTCNCGHSGFDHYIEHRPGSIQELLESLRSNGIVAFIEPWDPLQPERFDFSLAFTRLSTTYHNMHRRLVASTLANIRRMSTAWLFEFLDTTVRSSSDVAISKMPGTETPARGTHTTTSPAASLQNTLNIEPTTARAETNTNLTHKAVQSNHSPSSSVTQVAAGTVSIDIPEDFLLLCMRAKRFLTSRHDLGLAGITRDRDLFKAVRGEYKAKVRWARRQFSLRTAQRMSFVKFALHARSEVDGIITGMPPVTVKHYTCDPRKPDRIPALGSDFLMHRFTSPEDCFDDDICFKQMPKRIGETPKPGIDPDFYTGWGMHIEEGLDFERICLLLSIGIVTGGTFGIVWAICKRSLQDGFAVAGFIVGSEAVAVATLQLLLAFGTL